MGERQKELGPSVYQNHEMVSLESSFSLCLYNCPKVHFNTLKIIKLSDYYMIFFFSSETSVVVISVLKL